MNKHEPHFPMMMTYEVRALQKVLTRHSPVTVVEWGSGRSTLYFTALLAKKNIPYTWISVEHNQEWAEYVAHELGSNSNVHLLYVPKEDQVRYLTLPKEKMKTLGISRATLALVDGIYRNECLDVAHTFTDTVLLHDAQRKSYRKRGRYIAGRLFELGAHDSLVSRVHILWYHLHQILWKIKERLTQPSTHL